MAIVFILVVIKMVKFGGGVFFLSFFLQSFFLHCFILFFFETKHQRKEYYTI